MSTKCVKMCRNGDGFFPPVNVVVNPRDIRSMDAFLDRVTQATRMRNAARKVCTPNKGHKIEDLTNLISGETYVAVGQEAFKNLEYGRIRLRRPVNIQHREIKIEPVKHSRILMSARCRKVALWESSGLKTIYVYRNGDDKHPSHKILLDRRTLLNMDKVLELVTDRVKLESGAVFALYTMHGKEVNGTSELVNGEKYIAVGHGKRFKRTAYNDNHKISPNNSPRRAKVLKYKMKKSLVLPSATGDKQTDRTPEETGFTNEVKGKVLVSLESMNTTQTSRDVENTKPNAVVAKENQRQRQKTVEKIEKSESRTVEKPGNDHEDNAPQEDVFKASGAKSEKAKPVEDDKEVKVEKPIDHVAAEEVTEEIIDQNPSQIDEENDKPQEQVRPPSQGNTGTVNSGDAADTATEDEESSLARK